jgi:hypothetical protein
MWNCCKTNNNRNSCKETFMKSVLTTIAAVLALSAGTAFAQTAPVKAAPAPVAAPAPAKVAPAPAPAAASVPLNTVVHQAVQPGVKELPQVQAAKSAPKAATVHAKHKQHKHGHKHGHKHAHKAHHVTK